MLGFNVLEAADSLNIRTIGTLPYTTARCTYFDTTSRLLITGVGAGLWIHDVSLSGNPVEVARFEVPGIVYNVVKQGDFIFVAGYKKDLLVYDVSDMANPRLVYTHDDPLGFSYDLKIFGNYLYLADGGVGVMVFDITDPVNPSLINTISTAGPRRLLIENNLLYLGRYSPIYPALTIYDISDPASPVELGSLDSTKYVMGIAKSGNYVYLGTGYDGIMVVNVSDPANPVAETTLDPNGYISRMSIFDTLLAVAGGYGGLILLNIADQSNPSLISQFNTFGLAMDVVFNGPTYIYLANHYGGINALNISDPTSPILENSISVPGANLDVETSGNVAFLTGYYGYLRSIDLSDPSNPQDLAPWDNFQYGYSIAIVGDYAYTSAFLLYIYDISDPSNVQLVGTYSPPSTTRFVTTDGTYLYVATIDSGIVVLDISDPINPSRISTIQTGATPLSIYIDGTKAYVVDINNTLTILDVSDPSSPSTLGTFSIPDYPYNVVASGNLALVSLGYDGIISIDVSNPASPTILDSLNTSTARGMALKDTLLAVADMWAGVKLINVSHPDSLVMVGYYLTPGIVYNVDFYGDYILVPDNDGGFRILEYLPPVSTPEPPENPYWKITASGIRFIQSIPFEIYAVNGRMVRKGFAHPGMTLNLKTGVYIVKTGNFTQKILMR